MSKLFEGLKESIKDAGRFLDGDQVPELTLHTVMIKPPPKKSGHELKELREKYGLSQGALAEIVGVSRKSIEAWERDGVSSKPVARILQLIEMQPQLLGILIEEKRKKIAVGES